MFKTDSALRVFRVPKACQKVSSLKLWQQKTLHDQVMNPVPSKSPADEIVRQITLGASHGTDVSFLERLFSGVRKEEWQGGERKFVQTIVMDIREALKGIPTFCSVSTMHLLNRSINGQPSARNGRVSP